MMTQTRRAEQILSDLAFMKSLFESYLQVDRQLLSVQTEQSRVLLEKQVMLRTRKDAPTAEIGVQACIYEHQGFLQQIKAPKQSERELRQLILEN
jgi:hypothetical protein